MAWWDQAVATIRSARRGSLSPEEGDIVAAGAVDDLHQPLLPDAGRLDGPRAGRTGAASGLSGRREGRDGMGFLPSSQVDVALPRFAAAAGGGARL